MYRAASAASGSASRSFVAKPQIMNSQLSQATKVMGSQLWAQRRLFTEEAGSRFSDEERKPVVRSVGQVKFGLPPNRPKPGPKSTIYIGNLLFDITAEDLKNMASKHGDVVGTRIIYDSRGLSRGFGYVKFSDVETATRAVQAMHLSEVEGREVNVNFAQTELYSEMSRKTAEPTRTVFIGNIAHQITDRDLHELFDDIPNVLDVRVAVDRRTGTPRGFAHAEFSDVKSAIAGFEALDGKAPYGRPLRLDYSHSSRQSNASNATVETTSNDVAEAELETQAEVQPEAQQETEDAPKATQS
ncbi:hypothetical protein FQN49_001620 [Arthroderma sp. PD_2]|nr:hypothetical protein FQN49_001620 [Arthroderma sp. PD_2]